MRALSIAKIGENLVNEDAALAKKSLIAISDGAGGGGVFADKWSRYLIENLPEKPIVDFASFDKWIDAIWEHFYNECEKEAQKEGGMLLNKFYDEGSFATLVAVWSTGQWINYGDSVAFCYNMKTGVLEHSFSKLADFNNPPYLINCKDPLCPEGFRSGKFDIDDGCMVFATSDALAHYILTMYMTSRKDEYREELMTAIDAQTKNSNMINVAMALKHMDFEKTLMKLLNLKHKGHFKQHLRKLYKDGLLALDDYSLAIL